MDGDQDAMKARIFATTSLVLVSACGMLLPNPGSDDASVDAAIEATDVSSPDVSSPDVSSPDVSITESGLPDTGAQDAGSDAITEEAAAPVLITLGTSTAQASFITVDATYVYWTTYNPASLMKCTIGGCSGNPTSLVTGNYSFGVGVAVDANNAYFAMGGATAGTIYACAKGGCNNSPSTLASSLNAPYGVVTSGGGVYFSVATNATVEKTGNDGGAATLLAQQQGDPSGLAIDSVNAYWANHTGNTIVKCALGGCSLTPTVLADNQNGPISVAVDSTNVYWTNNSGDSVMACATGGCNNTPTTLATGQSGAYGIATDGINVYWTNVSAGTVMKCATSGCNGQPTTVASSQSSPLNIAVDGTSVYWTNQGGSVMQLTPK